MTTYSDQARSLEETSDRLRRAQKAGRLGTWDWNVLTNELVWDGVESVHGLEDGSFGGTFEGYLRDMHPEDKDRVLAAISQARETGSSLRIEYRIIQPDGSIIWVEGRGTCFQDPTGATTRMAGTCQDITDRKRAEEDKEHLLSFASHELRNPLTSVLGYARLLERRIAANKDAFDETTREAIETISSESQRMAEIMECFLDLARAESSRLELDIEPFDLGELLQDQVERVKLKNPDVEIQMSSDRESIVVRSDMKRVRQVVFNLIDNAIKYGGSPPEVRLKTEVYPDRVELRVSDNGPGIEGEDRSHLFERFYRGNARSTKSKGLGIGLYLSRQFIERLGGSLQLNSEPGQPTEFLLMIPTS